MQLAEFDCGLEVRLNVVLAPIELPQDGMSVDGIWFDGQMLLKNGDALVEVSLLQALCSLHNCRIRGPSNLVFNDRIRLVLQTRAPDDQRCYRSKDKSSDMRPMGHS